MDLNIRAQKEASCKKGQGLVEYALILVLIAIVVIIVVSLVGSRVNLIFAQIAVNMDPQYAGMFNGPALTLTGGVSIGSGMGGNRVNLASPAGATFCASITSDGRRHLICGAPPTFSTPITSACVIAVADYSLTEPVCAP